MGTNYYLHKNECPYCGRKKEIIHLGKNSYGWRFLFHKTKEIHDYESFCEFIKTGEIYDEYDRPISYEEMIKIVNHQQETGIWHKGAQDVGGYDFLEGDFS